MRKEQAYKSTYILFLNLAIVSLALLILSQFQIIQIPRFFTSTLLFFIVIFSISLSILYKSKLNHFHNRSTHFMDSFFQTSPYFFLAILITLAINQFLKLDFITERNTHIIILGVAFGFFSFYANRNKIERELEDEKQREESKEQQRANDFAYKFPRISRVWGLRSVVKWMYKEGWGYSVGLILIVAVGFVLRVWKILNLGLVYDEVFQVFSVNSINSFLIPHLGDGLYLRGILISYIGFALSRLGFTEILATRIPVTLAGIIILPLIYFISKRVGLLKRYALLVTLLASLELMLVQFSRISRFYLLSTLILLLFLFLFLSRKKPKMLPLIILITFSFLSEISLAIFIFASVFVAYFTVNLRNLKEDKKYMFSFLIIILFLLTFFFFYMVTYQSTFLDRILTFNLEANYLQKYISWLFSSYPHYILLILGGLIVFLKSRREKMFISIFFLTFLSILFATNLLDYNYTIRSFIVLIPIMLVISILSLNYLSKIVPKTLIVFVTILIIFSLIYDLKYLPLNYGDKYHPEKIMYEKLPIVLDWENPSIYIKDRYEEGDILISHAVNPYFLYYYVGEIPHLSVRHIGTSRYINGSYYDQFSEIRVVDDTKDLEIFIQESLDAGKKIWLLSSGANWGIDNPFYEKYFGKPITLEAPVQITDYLRIQEDSLAYVGKDGLTKVYLFQSD